jgi:hypothetical protein
MPKVAAFFLNTVASGYFFVWWYRAPVSIKRSVWDLYGWFTGLMCCGSCFGGLQVATYTQFQINFFQSGQEEPQSINRALEQSEVSLSHSNHKMNARFRNYDYYFYLS